MMPWVVWPCSSHVPRIKAAAERLKLTVAAQVDTLGRRLDRARMKHKTGYCLLPAGIGSADRRRVPCSAHSGIVHRPRTDGLVKTVQASRTKPTPHVCIFGAWLARSDHAVNRAPPRRTRRRKDGNLLLQSKKIP